MKQDILEELKDILGSENVVIGSSAPRFSKDGLRSFRGFKLSKYIPDVVVFPSNVEQISSIVKLAYENGIPIVAYGGGTGLMGAALAKKGGIVVSMKRMNKILSINLEDRVVRVEAGAIIKDVDRALNENGLMLGHDPWSAPRATIGGAISTNGMGYTAAKYGSIKRQVLGLKVVLPDGDVLETRAVEESSSGFNLNNLFIGTEGIFGIICEATLRVFPLPETREMACYRFRNFAEGFKAIMDIYKIGAVPTVLDYGDDFVFPPEPIHPDEADSRETYLFLLVDGFKEEVEAKMKRINMICRDHGGVEYEEDLEGYWNSRHDLTYLYEIDDNGNSIIDNMRSDIILDYVHVYIPASKVLDYEASSRRIAAKYGVMISERGIWKQPELFSIILVKPIERYEDHAIESMHNAIEELINLAHEIGGSMEYCHGVGIRLAEYMEQEHGKGLDVLRKIKNALDPKGIMNPGNMGL